MSHEPSPTCGRPFVKRGLTAGERRRRDGGFQNARGDVRREKI
jgi:hypothetical protein